MSVSYSTVNGITTATFSGTEELTQTFVSDNLNNSSIVIVNGYTTIGQAAFFDCSGIISITLSDTVTNIGNDISSFGQYGCSFQGCSSLTSINIPNSVTNIDGQCFYGCSSLTSITIPDNVNEIKQAMFRGCTNLTSIVLPTNGNFTSIARQAFYDCINLTLITIPDSVTSIGYSTFSGCANLLSVTIPTNIYFNSIEAYCFDGCSKLTSFIIPNNIKSVGANAFSGCIGLTSLILPNSVTHIGGYAGCKNLTSITLPTNINIDYIDNYAFYDCIKLTSITIPGGVVSIGNLAFCRCSSLTSITLPNSVSIIYRSAFADCSNLTSITLPTNINFTTIYRGAFSNCINLPSIVIPNSVTEIQSNVFTNCRSFTSFIIPNSVVTIGNDAFSDCLNLTKIYMNTNNGLNILLPKTNYYFYGKTLNVLPFPPTITSIFPINGSTLGGTTVSIVGTNFQGNTVKFGSNNADVLSINPNGTEIICISPSGSEGLVNVQVSTLYDSVNLNNIFTYISPPTITNISPKLGLTGGGALVTIVGTDLSGSIVKFGSNNANIVSINPSGTELICSSPSGSVGLVNIEITTPYGSITKNNAFTYGLLPTITSISPEAGLITGGKNVTIIGTDFLNSTVKFGTTNATNVYINTDGTIITCTSPVGNTGFVDITVENLFGITVKNNGFIYGELPTITSISPQIGLAFELTMITITGTNLLYATVKFGSNDASNVSVDPNGNSLTCMSPTGSVGKVNVQITTLFGSVIKNKAFTYGVPPTITNIYNTSGVVSGGTTVTIVGSDLANSDVYFGLNTAANVSIDDTGYIITCTSPAGNAGLADIQIITPFGNITRNNVFYYGIPPTVTSISTASGSTLGSTMVTIYGSNFLNSKVKFGANDTERLSIDPTGSVITCYTPSATTSGLVNIEVSNSFGVTTLNDAFTYGVSPTIASVSPVNGLSLGGTTVTIVGTDLSGSTVKFGANNATHISVNPSGTSITCKSPVGNAGLVNIEIITPFGSATKKNAFTYGAPPTITTISPTSGLTSGGLDIVGAGSQFIGTISIKFGTNNATNIQRNSAGTAFICKTPAGNAGLVNLEVTNPYGSETKNNAFTYI